MLALLGLIYSNPYVVVLFLAACFIMALMAGTGSSAPQKRPAAKQNAAKAEPAAPEAGPDRPLYVPAEEQAQPKRGRGRPRKYPAPDPNAPKRPRGRPRKNPAAAAGPDPSKPAALPAVSPVMQPEEFIKSLSA